MVPTLGARVRQKFPPNAFQFPSIDKIEIEGSREGPPAAVPFYFWAESTLLYPNTKDVIPSAA
jgi:hypothetical protein